LSDLGVPPDGVPRGADSGQRRRPVAVGCAIELLETLVLTLLIFVGVQTFVAQPYQVEQESMEQTVMPGEYILVDKLTPRFDGYKRGDIVVFHPPTGFSIGPDGDKPFIKRIIGTPGDTVEVAEGHVLVNGKALVEPYVFEGQPTRARSGTTRWSVAPGDYFVMGDHREASTDSRDFGPVAASQIIGRAWLRYWPLSRFGFLPTPRTQAAAP
jgi:signal peptidase I